MTANICSTIDEAFICRVEVPGVASLHDKDNDPINTRNDGVKGEGCTHVLILAPYCVAPMVMFAIGWSIEGVVNRCNNNEEP